MIHVYVKRTGESDAVFLGTCESSDLPLVIKKFKYFLELFNDQPTTCGYEVTVGSGKFIFVLDNGDADDWLVRLMES